MVREVELISYLPTFLQSYSEIHTVLSAEDSEFTIIWSAADRVLKNEFIATADEYGIAKFEKLLGVLPFEEDTIESRRARVHLKWFITIPYTLKVLIEKLITVCGAGNFSITTDFTHYRIKIETCLFMYGQTEEVRKLIDKILPCNMILELENEMKLQADFDMHIGIMTNFIPIYTTRMED